MIQQYLGNYYVNVDISKEINWIEKKYEMDVNFIGEILGKDGESMVQAQSLLTEKTIPHCIPPAVV